MPRLSLVLPMLLVLGPPAHAAVNMVPTGRVGDGGTQVKNVATEGSHAFLAMEEHLTALDVSDPEHPVVLAQVPLPAPAQGIAVANGVAYVADGANGLLIYDVSDPSSPQLVTTHAFNAVHVAWEEDWLYVCGGMSGLRILDVTAPAAPLVYSTYDHPNPGMYLDDIELRGNTVYVGAADYSASELPDAVLLVLDITTPTTILRKTIAGGSGSSMRVGLYARHLYGASSAGAWIWDLLADPNDPALVKTFSIGFGVYDLTAANGYLHAMTLQGLRTYDVLPAASTFQTQFLGYSGQGRGVLVGDQLFHACGDHGVKILKVDEPVPGQAANQGGWDRMTTASRLLQRDDIIYAGGERLWILDASQPGPPTVISDVNVGGVWGLARSGNYLYVGGDPEMAVVDVSNPGSPVVVKRISGRIMDLEVKGNFLYALEQGGLRLYELTDPANPTPRSFHAQGGRWHLAVHEDYVYLSSPNWNFVTINDYSNPDAPVYVANAPFLAWEMEAVDGKLYSACGESGFRMYDLADPLAPALLGGLPLANSRGLHVDGNRVGVADIWYGVSVVDVTNPASMVVLGSHEEPWSGVNMSDVLLAGNQVYTAAHFNGLFSFELVGTAGVGDAPVPTALALTAAPNPFVSGTTLSLAGAATGPATLRIHDAGGRLVRAMTFPDGVAHLAWDGRDQSARLVPAGVYFARVDTRGGTARERITVVR